MTASIFFEIHRDLPQEAPGSDASTRRALAAARPLPARPAVLDLGCGPGRQTLVLARELPGARIRAVDTHRPFLDAMAARIAAELPGADVTPIEASMDALPFDDRDRFDLIWSEGALYCVGVENALRYLRGFLAPGGVLAMTELSWLRDPADSRARAFLAEAYPAMRSLDDNLALARACGYDVVDHFVLPPDDWWDGYYTPLSRRLDDLERRYAGDPAALEQIAAERYEIDLYRESSDRYGYVFFILRPLT